MHGLMREGRRKPVLYSTHFFVQATTHMCAPLVIVNGPMARELGMNSGHNAFGPGRVTAFANAAQLTAWWGRDTLGFMQKERVG